MKADMTTKLIIAFDPTEEWRESERKRMKNLAIFLAHGKKEKFKIVKSKEGYMTVKKKHDQITDFDASHIVDEILAIRSRQSAFKPSIEAEPIN